MKDYIFEVFNNSPVILISNKKYCINSLTDHIPITQPNFLKQIQKEMSEKVDFTKADVLVGEEDRGGYLCALMSIHQEKPFTLTKWNPTNMKGETLIEFRNLYTHGNLYLNGISEMKNKKVIIVEDIIDTGGTIVAMVELLRKNSIEIIDIIAVAEKADYGGIEKIEKETGIKPKVLVSFISEDQSTKVVNRF